jgi:hypothetical protein
LHSTCRQNFPLPILTLFFQTFISKVTKQSQQITQESETAQLSIRNSFIKLRQVIDEKEKEMEESLKRVVSTKHSSIQFELNSAKQRFDKIESSIKKVGDALVASNSLEFLQVIFLLLFLNFY